MMRKLFGTIALCVATLSASSASAGLVFNVAVDSAVLFTEPGDEVVDVPYTPHTATLSTSFGNEMDMGSITLFGVHTLVALFDANVATNSVYLEQFLRKLAIPAPAPSPDSGAVYVETDIDAAGHYTEQFSFELGTSATNGPDSSSAYDLEYQVVALGTGAADLYTATTFDGDTVERLVRQASDVLLNGYQESYFNIFHMGGGDESGETWMISDGRLVSTAFTTALPEPPTLTLLALGLIAAVTLRRRTRRASSESRQRALLPFASREDVSQGPGAPCLSRAWRA